MLKVIVFVMTVGLAGCALIRPGDGQELRAVGAEKETGKLALETLLPGMEFTPWEGPARRLIRDEVEGKQVASNLIRNTDSDKLIVKEKGRRLHTDKDGNNVLTTSRGSTIITYNQDGGEYKNNFKKKMTTNNEGTEMIEYWGGSKKSELKKINGELTTTYTDGNEETEYTNDDKLRFLKFKNGERTTVYNENGDTYKKSHIKIETEFGNKDKRTEYVNGDVMNEFKDGGDALVQENKNMMIIKKDGTTLPVYDKCDKTKNKDIKKNVIFKEGGIVNVFVKENKLNMVTIKWELNGEENKKTYGISTEYSNGDIMNLLESGIMNFGPKTEKREFFNPDGDKAVFEQTFKETPPARIGDKLYSTTSGHWLIVRENQQMNIMNEDGFNVFFDKDDNKVFQNKRFGEFILSKDEKTLTLTIEYHKPRIYTRGEKNQFVSNGFSSLIIEDNRIKNVKPKTLRV